MSPKSKKQFDEIRQKSMVKIKEVALALFAHNGFHNTSISSIAKEAGISKGLLYNYFASKDALLEALLEDAIAGGEALMGEMLDSDLPAKDKLKMTIEGSIQMIQSNTRYWRLLTGMGLQPEVFSSLQNIISAKIEQGQEFGEAIFKEMGLANPKLETLIFGAYLDGMFLQYITMTALDFEYPLEEMKVYLFQKYGIE